MQRIKELFLNLNAIKLFLKREALQCTSIILGGTRYNKNDVMIETITTGEITMPKIVVVFFYDFTRRGLLRLPASAS